MNHLSYFRGVGIMHCEVHSADSSIFSWPNRVSFALTFSEHSGLKHFSFNNFTDRAAVQITTTNEDP